MRLLVTGAGLVGTAIAFAARAAAAEVLLVDVTSAPGVVTCDVTDPVALSRIIQRHRPDAVVHTAGIIGDKVNRAPSLAVAVNVTGTVSVLECAQRAGVDRVVLISSLSVYDWSARDVAVREDDAGHPRSLYGASKLAAETLARCVAEGGGPRISALRLAGVYGAGEFRGGARLGATLTAVIRRVLRHEVVTLPAVLGCVEYLSARDAARAVLLDLAHSGPQWRVLNIGAGRVHTAAQLSTILGELVPGATLLPPLTAPDVPPLDISAARSALGYAPLVSLRDGLAEMIAHLSGVRAAPAEAAV